MHILELLLELLLFHILQNVLCTTPQKFYTSPLLLQEILSKIRLSKLLQNCPAQEKIV